jgi:hypothetical protein
MLVCGKPTARTKTLWRLPSCVGALTGTVTNL